MNLLELNLDHPALLDYRLRDGRSLGAALDELALASGGAHQALLAHRGEWPLGWLDLPQGGPVVAQCLAEAQRLSDLSDELIVCGIGGSALGTQAVYAALDWPLNSLRPVYVLDNIDPIQITRLVEIHDLRECAINVISKSGNTLETMAGFFYLLKLAGQGAEGSAHVDQRVAATTDPERSILLDLARSRGWTALPVPRDVGGRFSVLSAVGLLPLAYAGVDVAGLLQGAAELQAWCASMPTRDNAAWRLAALHYLLHTQGRANTVVHYIYGDPLTLLGDWFRQLWAESLAKARRLDGAVSGVCLTPLVARGTTDQHSQNQLFMEGPEDKVYGFVSIRERSANPQAVVPDDPAVAALAYFAGQPFSELLYACCAGTRDALREAGRPVYEITFPRLSAAAVGAYLQLWMLATAYAGILYGVNAFDQPGVERSKQLTRARLGGSRQ